MNVNKPKRQCRSGKLPVIANTSGLPSREYDGLRLVNKYEAARILGVSPETLKKYRLQPDSPLIEGIHYHVWNARTIRYNPDLIADWGVNRTQPEQHQRAIEAYLASMLSNQRKRGRKAG